MNYKKDSIKKKVAQDKAKVRVKFALQIGA